MSAKDSAKNSMNYDLRDKQDRKRFLRYANSLMRNQRRNVRLIDESCRTLNQNSYLHVLCRILALDTGVTEKYAKDVYFKGLSNPDIFLTETSDPITGAKIRYVKSTKDLSITEMSKAINNFRYWAEQNGYYLPDASINDDGEITFKSKDDEEMFRKAEMETSKFDNFL